MIYTKKNYLHILKHTILFIYNKLIHSSTYMHTQMYTMFNVNWIIMGYALCMSLSIWKLIDSWN